MGLVGNWVRLEGLVMVVVGVIIRVWIGRVPVMSGRCGFVRGWEGEERVRVQMVCLVVLIVILVILRPMGIGTVGMVVVLAEVDVEVVCNGS